MVGISADAIDKSKELAEKSGLTFPLLSDHDLATTRAYGVEDLENNIPWPAIFIIAPDGTIRWRSLAETYKVRPPSEVVLEALTQGGF